MKEIGVRKGSIYMLFAFSVAGGSLFIFNLLAARTLGTSEYGQLGVFYSLFSFLSFLLSTGTRSLVVRYLPDFELRHEEEKIVALFYKTLKFVSLSSLLTVGAFIIFFKQFLTLFFGGDKVSYLLFLPTLIFSVFFYYLQGFLQGFRKIKELSTAIYVPYILLLFLSLLFYFYHLPRHYFELSLLLSTVFRVVISLFFLLSRFSLQQTKAIFSISYKEIFYMTFIDGFLNSFFALGIIFMKIKAFDLYKIGIFNAELTLFQGARNLFTAFLAVLYPYFSYTYAKGEKTKFLHYFKRGITIIVFIGILLLIASSTFLPSLWKFMFGKGYTFSRVSFIILSIALVFHLFTRILTRAHYSLHIITKNFIAILLSFFLFILIFFLIPVKTLFLTEISLLVTAIFSVGVLSVIFFRGISHF